MILVVLLMTNNLHSAVLLIALLTNFLIISSQLTIISERYNYNNGRLFDQNQSAPLSSIAAFTNKEKMIPSSKPDLYKMKPNYSIPPPPINYDYDDLQTMYGLFRSKPKKQVSFRLADTTHPVFEELKHEFDEYDRRRQQY
nr:hypothetical protein [Abalone asfa-like virus]